MYHSEFCFKPSALTTSVLATKDIRDKPCNKTDEDQIAHTQKKSRVREIYGRQNITH